MPLEVISKISPVIAMKREVAGLRLRDQKIVTENYKSELAAVEEKRKQAQSEAQRAKERANKQADEFERNEIFLQNALDEIKATATSSNNKDSTLPIKRVQGSTIQTWEWFCKMKPLIFAIRKSKPEIFKYLLNATKPEFAIDYTCGNLSAYELALSLSLQDQLTNNEKNILDVMRLRVLEDLCKKSPTGELHWFSQAAIYYDPQLINITNPTQKNFTPAMQLAVDNHLEELIVINQTISEGNKEFGIAFDLQDDTGKTILDHALQHGHKELSLWLLEQSKLELSPIEKACIDNDLKKLDELLAINDDTVDPAIRGNAPLLLAVMHGHDHLVTRLIASKRVDIKAHNNIAVITAVRYGYINIAKQLVASGADITARNDLALNFAKNLLSTNDQSLKSKRLEILNFVYQSRCLAKTSQQVRSAIKIQHSWGKHQLNKLTKAEQNCRNNINKEEATASIVINSELQKLKILFKRYEPTMFLNSFNANKAKENYAKLTREQKIQLAYSVNDPTNAELMGRNGGDEIRNIISRRAFPC